MNRNNFRTSRALILVLVLLLVVAAVASVKQFRKNVQTAKADPAAKTVAASTGAPVHPVAPLPTVTPTPLATRPVVTVPATRPVPVAPPVTPASLAQGKAKMDAGDPLAARKVLTDLVRSGSLNEADGKAARVMINEISKKVVFSTARFPADIYQTTYDVQRGESMASIAAKHFVTADLLCRINGIPDPRRLPAGATIKVLKGPFHAVVSKSRFTLDIYGGAPGESNSALLVSYPVGLGTDNSTPVGLWQVDAGKKLKNPTYHSTRGEGVIAADDPKNPLGEYWIALTGIEGEAVGKMSYGIHGTIDPSSIGKQASLGCIRMLNEDVAVVFEMLVGSSTVKVVE